MIAVDTNVVVRLLTRDDAAQFARAAALFASDEIWIAKTVLLETEWVLRSLYHYKPAQVEAAVRGLVGLPNVSVEDGAAIARAFQLLSAGLDLADALHVACPGEAESFATFDDQVVKHAKRAGLASIFRL